MARVKKSEAGLTLEEKLEKALVANWDFPYQVPQNWSWVRVASLCSLSNGKAFKPTDWSNSGLPIVRIQNLNNPDAEYNFYSGIVEEKFSLHGGELLFAWSGTPGTSFGAHIWWGKGAVLNQHIFRVDFDETKINKTYFKLALNQQLDMLISSAHGGAGLQHVTKGVFEATPIPLPPLAEQIRIVDRIESLFAKLDEAKEKAQATLDSFETRKAAILHKAFTGELTAKWREEHDTDLSEWRKCLLSDVVSEFKYGTSEKSDYNNAGMPVIRIPNIGDDGLDFTDLKYLPRNNVETESQIHENDVLIIRSNGSRDLVGKSVRVPHLDQPYTYASFLIRIKPTPIVRSDYLVAYLNSADARSQMFKKAKSSAGINNINSKELGAITLSLPSTEEQFEIVQILENHISKEQRAKNISEAVLEQIDLIKKAILSRAFRGELGTNDPTEESALELLKSILVDKKQETPDKPSKRRIVIPDGVAALLSSNLEKELIKVFYKEDGDLVPMSKLMAVSSKKFEVIGAIKKLQQKGIIQKTDNGDFKLMR